MACNSPMLTHRKVMLMRKIMTKQKILRGQEYYYFLLYVICIIQCYLLFLSPFPSYHCQPFLTLYDIELGWRS
ncbi:hypothetical protein CH56_2259 [Yersinia pestis Angola]|nr:hypothetical protein CH56_2259 [Yersinia pestis Angola]